MVLNPLASGEVVLTEQERQMGVAVCDLGGGTTDLAIYVDGDVWHTMVLAVGGNHLTQDMALGLRLPQAQAEEIKKQQGHAVRAEVGAEEYFNIRPFGEDQPVQHQPPGSGAHHRSPHGGDLQPDPAGGQALGLRRPAAGRDGTDRRHERAAGHPPSGTARCWACRCAPGSRRNCWGWWIA